MSAPKFTPGPWSTHREGHSTVYVDAPLGGGVLQEVAACGPTAEGAEQQDANARLIAAAPELYEALEAVELACRMGIPPGEVLSLNSTIRLAARAALAKARGEA